MTRRADPTDPGPRDTDTEHSAALKRLGHNLRDARLARGLSQLELATLTKMTRSVTGKIERGEQNLTLHTLTQLAVSLGISARSLLHGGSPLDPGTTQAIEDAITAAVARHDEACRHANTTGLPTSVAERLKRLARREAQAIREPKPGAVAP